jgi:heme-degrading monooxygenase HmoA
MIYEVANILIKGGMGQKFEQGFSQALPLFERAAGCKSARLERSVEDIDRYQIVIGWQTLDDHVVGFRTSADYALWRELVGDFFAAPPVVDHTEVVVPGFCQKDRV